VAHTVHTYKSTGYPVACQTVTGGGRTIVGTIFELGARREMGDERHAPGKHTWYTFYIGTDMDGSVLSRSQLVSNSIIRPRSESHTEYSLPATHLCITPQVKFFSTATEHVNVMWLKMYCSCHTSNDSVFTARGYQRHKNRKPHLTEGNCIITCGKETTWNIWE
jgi:hypothetical protein